jgi:hypothetical protein
VSPTQFCTPGIRPLGLAVFDGVTRFNGILEISET